MMKNQILEVTNLFIKIFFNRPQYGVSNHATNNSYNFLSVVRCAFTNLENFVGFIGQLHACFCKAILLQLL